MTNLVAYAAIIVTIAVIATDSAPQDYIQNIPNVQRLATRAPSEPITIEKYQFHQSPGFTAFFVRGSDGTNDRRVQKIVPVPVWKDKRDNQPNVASQEGADKSKPGELAQVPFAISEFNYTSKGYSTFQARTAGDSNNPNTVFVSLKALD